MTDPSELPPRLVLFDGVCGLCNHAVQLLVRADRRRMLRYAPLQGETAAKLRAVHPTIPSGLDTIVFIDAGRVYLRAQGILAIATYLDWPWRAARLLRWIPRFVADAAYGCIAHFRYRLFGKSDVCRLPEPHERELFLP
ncbi:thiol-disulfide oxidoreductase DCC family protein [Pendulispora albinea]|uniref:DCC1-like thiol-disulfide oxidoreductase family protein n=1 Tax=Pendulispora albinea TaxID=2741071 RepID=A0ABZ2LQQ8_9BACT